MVTLHMSLALDGCRHHSDSGPGKEKGDGRRVNLGGVQPMLARSSDFCLVILGARAFHYDPQGGGVQPPAAKKADDWKDAPGTLSIDHR